MSETNMSELGRLEAMWESDSRFSVEDMKIVLRDDYNQYKTRKWTKCMVGESGIGKTWLCAQVAKELGINFETLVGSGLSAEDIRGFPMPVRKLHHNGYKADELAKVMADYYTTEPIYKFQLLETLSKVFTPGWEGILLLDEWAQAPKEVQDVFFQIVYDRKMDEKYLPEKVMVVTAMNPPYMSEYMLSKLSYAAEDRLEFYIIEATASEWLKWAKKSDIDNRVIDFISEHNGVFRQEKGRRLHNLSDKLIKYTDLGNIEENKGNGKSHSIKVVNKIPEILHKEIRAVLRPESAGLFIKYLSNSYIVSGLSVLTGSKRSMDFLSNSVNNESRIIHLHRVHTEILNIIESPVSYLGKKWKISQDKLDENDRIQFDKTKNWMPLTENLMAYLRLISVTGPDIVMAFLKQLFELTVIEFENVFNVLLENEQNIVISDIICKSLSYPEYIVDYEQLRPMKSKEAEVIASQ